MGDRKESLSVYRTDAVFDLSVNYQVADMTPTAANAWVKVEEAKRDAVVVPSKQHTVRTCIAVAAIVVLPLESLLGVPLPAVLSSAGALAGVWATIEIVRAVKRG